MTTNLRSKVIRLAHGKPELRPVLLPLLKTGSFPRVEKEIEDDYRRKAITRWERDELLAAIENVEMEWEAQKIVALHRKGRTASSLQRSDVPEFLAHELMKVPGFKVKTSPGGKLTLTVGAFNPEVKSIEFTGLNTDKAPFKMYLKNGLSGWGWDKARQVFYSDKNDLRLDVVFDGKRDPASELQSFVKLVVLEGVKRALTTLNPLPPSSPLDLVKAQAEKIQAELKAAGIPTSIKWGFGESYGNASFIADDTWVIIWLTDDTDSKLRWFLNRERGGDLPGSSKDYSGGFPLSKGDLKQPKHPTLARQSHPILGVKARKRLVSEVKVAFDKLKAAREEEVKAIREKALQEKAIQEKAPEESSDQVWSVVTLGRDHGYATDVATFDSKAAAEREAKSMGNVYVVKGTQMWNEPLGQVEEHDRTSPSRFFP